MSIKFIGNGFDTYLKSISFGFPYFGGLARPNVPLGTGRLSRRVLKMFVVYILFSEKYDRFYIGFSENLKNRLKAHNKGETKSTKPYIPWRVVYTEEFKTKQEARIREKYLKSAAGRRWRKNNIGLGD